MTTELVREKFNDTYWLVGEFGPGREIDKISTRYTYTIMDKDIDVFYSKLVARLVTLEDQIRAAMLKDKGVNEFRNQEHERAIERYKALPRWKKLFATYPELPRMQDTVSQYKKEVFYWKKTVEEIRNSDKRYLVLSFESVNRVPDEYLLMTEKV